MAQDERLICASNELADGDKGVRFSVEPLNESRTVPAFMIRYQGRIYAYLNRCAHIGVELDWIEGEFFDDSGLYLVCSTHGAIYEPHSGFCVGGPCKGKNLQRLEIEERDGNIFLKD
jgi:nitrite reductase/ring-hydroxylating ferredoxin subunit